MRRWTRAMAAMAAAAAWIVPAAAQADDAFCADLDRILAAAAEPEPFAGFETGAAAAPSLGFNHCFRGGGGDSRTVWLCHQNLAPVELSAERLAERTRACRPEAQALPVRGWGPDFRFRIGGSEIEISEMGGPRAHVGRIVSYSVAAAAE